MHMFFVHFVPMWLYHQLWWMRMICLSLFMTDGCFPVPLFTKMTPSYGYRDPHYKPKTVWRPSQVYNGNHYTAMIAPVAAVTRKHIGKSDQDKNLNKTLSRYVFLGMLCIISSKTISTIHAIHVHSQCALRHFHQYNTLLDINTVLTKMFLSPMHHTEFSELKFLVH